MLLGAASPVARSVDRGGRIPAGPHGAVVAFRRLRTVCFVPVLLSGQPFGVIACREGVRVLQRSAHEMAAGQLRFGTRRWSRGLSPAVELFVGSPVFFIVLVLDRLPGLLPRYPASAGLGFCWFPDPICLAGGVFALVGWENDSSPMRSRAGSGLHWCGSPPSASWLGVCWPTASADHSSAGWKRMCREI